MSSATRKRTFFAPDGQCLTGFGGIIGGCVCKIPLVQELFVVNLDALNRSNEEQVNVLPFWITLNAKQWWFPSGEKSREHCEQHCATASARVGPATSPEL
jgi:hypothetical protein